MQTDVLQILREDHAVLARLAERLDTARPGRPRRMLFNEFALALGAHQTVVDHTLVPALKTCGWNGVSSDVLRGHLGLKRLLAEALTLERDPDGFDAVLRRLASRARAHCELEALQLVPVLQRCFDSRQRAALAADAEQHLIRLLGDTSQVHEDEEFGPDAEALVEEAFVVLGSFPVRDPVPPGRR